MKRNMRAGFQAAALTVLGLFPAMAVAADDSAPVDPVQKAYDVWKPFMYKAQNKKTYVEADISSPEKSLLQDLDSSNPALARAAARALSMLTAPDIHWMSQTWLPGFDAAKQIVETVLPHLNPARTPDLGARADLVQFVTRLSCRIGDQGDFADLLHRVRVELVKNFMSDKDDAVAARAIKGLYMLAPPDARNVPLARINKDARQAVRAVNPGNVAGPSTYSPIVAAAPLSNFEAVVGQIQADSVKNSRDVAANKGRDQKGPLMTASAAGWGEGVDPMDLLAGDLDCRNDYHGRCGLALPGNGNAGTTTGWLHVTLILPKAETVDRFVVTVYDYMKTPTHFRLLGCAEGECRGADDWKTIKEETNNTACTAQDSPQNCGIEIQFSRPIAVRQLRFEVDGNAYKGPYRHFWITGVHAYAPDSSPAAN